MPPPSVELSIAKPPSTIETRRPRVISCGVRPFTLGWEYQHNGAGTQESGRPGSIRRAAGLSASATGKQEARLPAPLPQTDARR